MAFRCPHLTAKQHVQQPVLQQAYLECPDDAKADVLWMQQTLKHGLEELHISKEDAQHFWQHMHFATDPVPTNTNWIPTLLKEWTSPRKIITVISQSGDGLESRRTLSKAMRDRQAGRLCDPCA